MPNKHEERLAFAAHKAATREDYMAYILTQYQQRQRLSETELVKSLKISNENYIRLMLCKAPDPQAEDYEQRVARISAYIGASAADLTRIIQIINQPIPFDKTHILPRRFRRWRKNLQRFRPNTSPVWRWAAAAALILCFAALSFMLFKANPDTPQTALVSQTRGQVQFAALGSDDWQTASLSLEIKTGTQIRTQSQTSATLTLFDGSVLDLDPTTQIALVQLDQKQAGTRTVVLRQDAGRVHFSVQTLADARSRFEVQTPSAVIQVRGTEFIVAVSADGATHVDVISGVVEVTTQHKTEILHAGETTTVQPERPPQVTATYATQEPLQATATLQPTAAPSSPTPTTAPTALSCTATSKPTAASTLALPTVTPKPEPGATKHVPPGQTKTPQPPGQEKTPPGQDKPPKEPPGQGKKPKK